MVKKKILFNSLQRLLNEGKVEQIRKLGLSLNYGGEGEFLSKQQTRELEKEIEANYNTEGAPRFGPDNNDIRTNVFNYDNPHMEVDVDKVNLRVAAGLIEKHKTNGKKTKTYLLYADGEIIAKFYSLESCKKALKYIIGSFRK